MSKKTLLLAISFLIVILHHFLGYSGHFGFDDMQYAKLSKDILDGHLDLISDHFSYRWTIIFTTALSYLLFGISDFSSGLGAMLCTLATLYFTYSMVKEKPVFEVAFSLILVATTSWLLFYSDKLMPDLYIVLSFTAAFYFLYHVRFVASGKNNLLFGFFFVFSIFFGFLSKGTIVLFLPLFGIILITDIIKKEHLKFWISSIIFGILLLIAYLILIKYLTGDYLYRFTAIKNNSYLNTCSYFNMPVKYLLKRISYELLQMFVTHDLILFYIFLIPALFQNKFSTLFNFNKKETFFFSSSIILLVLANFMSISLTTYNPMCIDPRHYLYIVPVASIAASKYFSEFIEHKNNLTNWLTILLSIFIVIIAFIAHHKSIAFWKYIPLAILLLSIQVVRLRQNHFISSIAYFLFFAILLVYTGKNMLDPYKENYFKQKNACIEFIENKKDDGKIAILTNNAQKRFGDYYLGFDSTSNIKFYDYSDDSLIFQNSFSEIYIMLNPHTRYMSFQTLEDLPWYAAFAEQLFEPALSKDYISFYKVDLTKLELQKKLIIKEFHDFESEKELWNNKQEQWVHEQFYSGSNSVKLVPGAYSPTFSLSMDSIKNIIPENSEILLQTSVFCLTNEDTPAVLVASLDIEKKPYYWQASNINHFSKVFDNWEKAKLTRMLPKEIKEGSILNIYVWNNGNKDLYIDDFEIKLNYLTNQ